MKKIKLKEGDILSFELAPQLFGFAKNKRLNLFNSWLVEATISNKKIIL